jgi:hypothetical protein
MAEMKTLACMATHMDGAHCGLGDWYPEIEKGIQKALKHGPKQWTTGWYASKKEIASAKITCQDGKIKVEVSVSDDFDTEGLGSKTIPHTTDLEVVRETIYAAWDEANGNQKDNRCYVGFSILTRTRVYSTYIGGKPQGKGRMAMSWVETYIRQSGDGYCLDSPPGDNYSQWGFQGEYDIPDDVKERLAKWAEQWPDDGKKEFKCKGFTIKPWEEDEHGND